MTRRYLTYAGETLHLSAWARRFGHQPKTLHNRLARGWTLQQAFETPVQERCKLVRAIEAYEARQREEKA